MPTSQPCIRETFACAFPAVGFVAAMETIFFLRHRLRASRKATNSREICVSETKPRVLDEFEQYRGRSKYYLACEGVMI